MSTEFDSILPKGDFSHPVNITSTPHASVQRVSLAVQRGMSPEAPEHSGCPEIVDPSPVSADSVFERLRGAKTVTPELLAECARLWEDPSAVARGTVLDAETLAAHNEEAWRWACTRETVLRNEIKRTLTENAHLADGENCTLARLKKLVPEWESEFLANNELRNAHGDAPKPTL